jgi:hypothetical protein
MISSAGRDHRRAILHRRVPIIHVGFARSVIAICHRDLQLGVSAVTAGDPTKPHSSRTPSPATDDKSRIYETLSVKPNSN